MPNYTKGRAIAFLLSAVFVFLLWGYIFTPHGLGANVVLGLAIAIAFMYMMTTNLGPFLDDLFFHGGSRERALALRRAEHTAQQISTKLTHFRKLDQANLDSCKKAVSDLISGVKSIRSKHVSDAKGIAADIKHINDLEKKAEQALELAIRQPFKRHGLFTGWFSLLGALAAAIALRIFIIEPYQIPSGSMIPTLLVGDHLFVSKLSYGIMNPFAREPSYIYRWDTPKPGEVVIFHAPEYVRHNAGETWIKRVIAGPGQTIQVKGFVIYVDGVPYEQKEIASEVNYMDFSEGKWKPFFASYSSEKIGDHEHSIYQNRPGAQTPVEKNWSAPVWRQNHGLDCTGDACRVKEGYVFVMGDNRGHSSDGRYWGALPIENVKGRALFIWMSVDGSQTSIELGRFTLPGFRFTRSFQGIN